MEGWTMRNRQWILLLCIPLVAAVQAAEVQPDHGVATPPIFAVESPYSFEETVQNLRSTIGGSNFRMIREQPWDYGLESGVKGSRDTILYFCNFDMVNQAIKADQRIGQFLPFRVTVVEQAGRVLVMAVDPQPLMQVLDADQLGDLRSRVAFMYRELIDEGLF
jgi:cytochrome c oxidase cbb3-type subunit 3